MMKRYDEKTLHALLDKYENSLLYTGSNQRNQTISVAVTKRFLPEYFDETSLQCEEIHAQLLEMEQRGLIKLVWKNQKVGHILEKCILCPERSGEIYALLHRVPRKEKESAILKVCKEHTGENSVTDCFLTWIEERIRTGESIRQYVDEDHPEELEIRLRLIQAMLANEEEVFLREFSVAFFKDSKAAAGEIAGAAGIITQFSEDPVFCGLTTEQVLEECNIYPNPSWIYVKGRGTFLAGASRIELSSFPSGIGLSGKDIKNVCWNEENPPEKVVTIENLTSFHRWQDASSLAVYLGGYHNRAKRLFLKSIYEAYSDALYCHFGDLDCGGFLIFKDLSEKTGIPFLTVKMDEETYLNYLDSGRELTSHDRRELLRMMEDPFFVNQRGLFKRMLKEGKKLEQECIRL